MTIFNTTILDVTDDINRPVRSVLDEWSIAVQPDKEPLILFSMDPLAASCALHRLITTGQQILGVAAHAYTLNDAESYADLITVEDFQTAAKVRKHFADKFLVKTLLNEPLTKFRQDAYTFITTDFMTDQARIYALPQKFVGLVYRLPGFYAYDIALVEMFGSTTRTISDTSVYFVGPTELTFVRKLDSGVRRKTHTKTSVYEYWFNTSNGEFVLIEMEKNDNLLALWEKQLTEPIIVQGTFSRTKRESLEYHKAGPGWSLNV
jgi:hypothetical protein